MSMCVNVGQQSGPFTDDGVERSGLDLISVVVRRMRTKRIAHSTLNNRSQGGTPSQNKRELQTVKLMAQSDVEAANQSKVGF